MAKRSKADEKRVREMAQTAAVVFFLGGYEMNVDFSDVADSDGADAMVHCNYPYRQFKLTIYPRFFAEPESAQMKILVHEMAHVITYPLVRLVDEAQSGRMVTERERCDAWEHVADWIMAIVTE